MTGCADGLIRLFNASTGRLIKQFREHNGGVEKLDIGLEKIVSTGIDKLVSYSSTVFTEILAMQGAIDHNVCIPLCNVVCITKSPHLQVDRVSMYRAHVS